MAVRTSNRYGKIVVTNRALYDVVNATIGESYGVSGGRAVYVEISDEKKININLRVSLKFGVNREAVTESLRQQVKYNVENFSGVGVAVMNIRVEAIK